MMIDTSYVVDLLRERRIQAPGPAIDFLQKHRAVKLRMPVFVLCELELGVSRVKSPDPDRMALQEFCEFVEIVYPEDGFAPAYARVVSGLLDAGTPIPVLDALIGTIAFVHSEPIVTSDTRHFERIDGLVVLSHTQGR